MRTRRRGYRRVAFSTALAVLALESIAIAVDPFELANEVGIAAASRSNLIRETNRVASTVQVTVTNQGAKSIEAPLHLAIEFSSPDTLDGLEAVDALGGIGPIPTRATISISATGFRLAGWILVGS